MEVKRDKYGNMTIIIDDIMVAGANSINFLTDLYQEVHNVEVSEMTMDGMPDNPKIFLQALLDTIKDGHLTPRYSMFEVYGEDDALIGTFKKMEQAIAAATNYESQEDKDATIVLVRYYTV